MRRNKQTGASLTLCQSAAQESYAPNTIVPKIDDQG
jgi:hypothetical protein